MAARQAEAGAKRQLRTVALFGEDLLPAEPEPSRDLRLWARAVGAAARALPRAVEFRILAGEVGKGIYWANGSQLLVFKPDESAVRGEAADVFWLDEAQDVDLDDAAELLAGLKPLMDTKPGAALDRLRHRRPGPLRPAVGAARAAARRRPRRRRRRLDGRAVRRRRRADRLGLRSRTGTPRSSCCCACIRASARSRPSR
jgi:hypothetical protein